MQGNKFLWTMLAALAAIVVSRLKPVRDIINSVGGS
jgi:hypothetical protein